MTIARIQPTFRLLFSGAVIFAVVAAVAAASGAFTTAPASANNITLSTGNAALQIAADNTNTPGSYGSSITGPTISGLTPGETETFKFWLKNNSDDDLQLDLAAKLEELTSSNTAIKDDMDVIFLCDTKATPNPTRDGNTLEQSLTAWFAETGSEPFSAHPTNTTTPGRLGPNAGAPNGSGSDEAQCTMEVTLDPASTANSANTSFDADFTGTTPAPVE